MCLFDGFISSLRFECSSSGSVSLLVIEPVIVAEIVDDPLRAQAISPLLSEGERGVVVFRPDDSFEREKFMQGEIFLSNCI